MAELAIAGVLAVFQYAEDAVQFAGDPLQLRAAVVPSATLATLPYPGDRETCLEWVAFDAAARHIHPALGLFEFRVLGRVIEQVTAQPYEEYVKANILAPCGVGDVKIGRNKEGQRFPDEVVYYGQYGKEPHKMNVTSMDSHGGCIATSSSLVQFLNHFRGFPNNPAPLKPETIRLMTTPTPAYPQNSAVKYARGWNVRQDGKENCWHNGSLSGSTTIMVRTSRRMCWAALANTLHAQMLRWINWFWNMVRLVPEWGA